MLMQKSRIIWRILLIVSFVILFASTAIFLYQKQQLKLNYLSFVIENSSHSFVVPDIDRVLNKIDNSSELEMDQLQMELKNAIDLAATHKQFSFNREVANECFISSNSEHFILVFNTTSSLKSIVNVLSEEFQVEVAMNEAGVNINGVQYFSAHFGHFLAFSTQEINPKEQSDKLYYGNADYVVFGSDSIKSTRHILSRDYHFSLWEASAISLNGKGVNHREYFEAVPADFEELVFYGSTRIQEDAELLFNEPNEESFDWLSNGLIYIRKGEWEMLLAPQGDSRDLKLMLEEQTLKENNSSEIAYFNIGNFKVMPFQTNFNWSASLSDLQSELAFYTEYDNFNLLSNSIPAMRWFLGQVQLGNLLGNNQLVNSTYQDCLPESAHYIRMLKDQSGGYLCESRIYGRDEICLYSSVNSAQGQLQMDGIEVVHDFQVELVPDKLTALTEGDENLILLNNANQLALYTVDGEKKWSLQLSSSLVEPPQIVDFENDGHFEIVLFQSNQLDVINIHGKSLNGFPSIYSGTSTAGLAVNYDNLYKYRLLVNIDKQVKVFSEDGKIVEGWMFEGMNSPLRGKIYHVITEGKDIITFKDQSEVQHVLNRKGEYRLENEINFSLPRETDFIVGSLESALRKMGYKNGYIYNYYILDGELDSVIIDQKVAPIKTFWEYNQGKPLLIIEEADRLLIVNQFGYVQSEVLKPSGNNQFVGLVGKQDYGFVFADNSQNTIYLLNNFGKMILPQAIEGSKVCIIEDNLLYSFSGISVKAYKIAD
jgi:hypothetical protein